LALSSIKDLKGKSNGFFYLAMIGDFRPARNGHFRPSLTTSFDLFICGMLAFAERVLNT